MYSFSFPEYVFKAGFYYFIHIFLNVWTNFVLDWRPLHNKDSSTWEKSSHSKNRSAYFSPQLPVWFNWSIAWRIIIITTIPLILSLIVQGVIWTKISCTLLNKSKPLLQKPTISHFSEWWWFKPLVVMITMHDKCN